jgi:MFS family permease
MAQAGRAKVEIGRAVAEPPVEEAEREALAVPAAARPAMPGGVRRRPLPMFDALQVRDFRLLWIGMIISNAGSWMQMIGQGWLVLQLTNSPFWLGMVAFARAVPVLAFSLFAGAVADRVDRRRLLLATQSTAGVLALLLAVLTSTGLVRVWEIMAIAFLSATTMAFDNPSRQALVPDMVGKDRLMNAVGLNSAAWNGAAVIGPSLAGVAIGVVGVAGCFYLNAASFLAVVWALWVMRARGKGGRGRGTMWQSIVEGLGYIARHRVVLALFLIAAIPNLLGRPYQQLMPVFARDVVHGGPRTYGLMMSASGAGALIGALLTASLGAFRRKGLILLAATAAFGLALIAFALSRQLLLSVALLVLVGGCATMYMGAANTLLQVGVAPDFRGRIMSVYSMTAGGLMPLGGMIFGAAASLTRSVALVVATGGAVVVCCAVAIGLAVPAVRAME